LAIVKLAISAALVLTACAPSSPHGEMPDAAISPSPDANIPPGDGSSEAAQAAMWHGRADQAVHSLLLRFWSQGAGYLEAQSPSSGSPTGYWTFAQALDAMLDAVERSNGASLSGWPAGMYDAQNAIGFSRNYYDDENWMTLALLRASALAPDPRFLTEAKALYADIMAAWDTTCCGPHPGGIWWDRPHTQKATAANAGPVITGVRLAAITGDSSYLSFAEQVYTYWRANMVNPMTFAVTDHINTDGTLAHYKFTYNEGLMIGAAVALYGATHNAQYLTDAESIAGYMLAKETTSTADGTVLFDGTNTGCTGDCAQFKGIAIRYLKTLAEADPSHPEYAATIAASAHAAWDYARDATTDLFATDWAGPTLTPTLVNAQSSAAMTIAEYAEMLGADPVGPGSAYEAEDGTLHALGLEASHAGFTGWGYVAGWDADGQWVDFHVNVQTAGTYQLTLRYAAGAGDATRLVYANGANVVTNQRFASTGAWDTWSTVTVSAQLPAGASTVSVIYNSGDGSTQYLNLDGLAIAK
jgi:predicted alpha-1,6-mannanase (GH76 family)